MTALAEHQAATRPAAENRDVLFALGMAAVSLAAAVSSYSGLATLADLAGWNHKLALLLPVTIDAYALTATRVWLSPRTVGHKARRWAKGNAIGAIATSVAGNAVAHAANAAVFHVTWPIVVAVSAIPSIVLGLITHLWHLRNTPDPTPVPVLTERLDPVEPIPAAVTDPVPDPITGPDPTPVARPARRVARPKADTTRRTPEELLTAAREAMNGRKPTAEGIRLALGIKAATARELRELLLAEASGA
ncbi:MAG TPA: DUF2637 domain-containing protein [Actinocrinis sp.]|nr:DUF2637 domain-containing protein [Actinocrinis sp.]